MREKNCDIKTISHTLLRCKEYWLAHSLTHTLPPWRTQTHTLIRMERTHASSVSVYHTDSRVKCFKLFRIERSLSVCVSVCCVSSYDIPFHLFRSSCCESERCAKYSWFWSELRFVLAFYKTFYNFINIAVTRAQRVKTEESDVRVSLAKTILIYTHCNIFRVFDANILESRAFFSRYLYKMENNQQPPNHHSMALAHSFFFVFNRISDYLHHLMPILLTFRFIPYSLSGISTTTNSASETIFFRLDARF